MKKRYHFALVLLLASALTLCGLDLRHPVSSPAPDRIPADDTALSEATDTPASDPAVSADITNTGIGSPGETVIPGSPNIPEAADMGQEYQNQIIFVGDSTTHHLRHRGGLPGGRDTKQVWTPASGTLTLAYARTAPIMYPDTGEEMTIAEAAGLQKPRIMIITLGINGISFMKEAQFKTVYTGLIKDIREASPETVIILQSIFPRAETGNENYQKITQEMIDAANVWVFEIAEECGTYFLDTQSVLKDDGGYLREKYSAGDGIHISKEGYAAILAYIRTHPVEIE